MRVPRRWVWRGNCRASILSRLTWTWSSCSSGSIDGLSPEQLLDQIMGAPLVQCDQVAWEMLGLSMASWNALASVGFFTLWMAAAAKSRS